MFVFFVLLHFKKMASISSILVNSLSLLLILRVTIKKKALMKLTRACFH